MKAEDIKSLEELTLEQMKKCDKVVKLLIELEEQGVHPFILDGGGGNGLSFVRCADSDMYDIGEIFTDNPREARVIDDEYVYTPAKSIHAKIPTWVP